MIRAIGTRYAFCFFRSRLEARWAVFLDALGIVWHYEAEGYELSSGRYLPDFQLPGVKCFVEIKPVTLSRPEMRKAYELAAETEPDGWRVLVLEGGIPQSVDDLPEEFFDYLLPAFRGWPDPRNKAVQAALTCAREARFEFGQSPDLTEARDVVARCYDQFTDKQADLAWADGWCFVCAGQHNGCAAEDLNLIELEREVEDGVDLGDLPADPEVRLEYLMEDHYEQRHAECEMCPTCGCSGSRCSFEFPD
jgi:hypothetical protein